MEDTPIVKIGGPGIVDKELECWVGTKKGQERVVVNEKRFGLSGLRRDNCCSKRHSQFL